MRRAYIVNTWNSNESHQRSNFERDDQMNGSRSWTDLRKFILYTKQFSTRTHAHIIACMQWNLFDALVLVSCNWSFLSFLLEAYSLFLYNGPLCTLICAHNIKIYISVGANLYQFNDQPNREKKSKNEENKKKN